MTPAELKAVIHLARVGLVDEVRNARNANGDIKLLTDALYSASVELERLIREQQIREQQAAAAAEHSAP